MCAHARCMQTDVHEGLCSNVCVCVCVCVFVIPNATVEMLIAAGYRAASIVVVTVNIHIIIILMSGGTKAIWKCCKVSLSFCLVIQHFPLFHTVFYFVCVCVSPFPFSAKSLSCHFSSLKSIEVAFKFVKTMWEYPRTDRNRSLWIDTHIWPDDHE